MGFQDGIAFAMSDVMKTKLHTYHFNINKESEREAYDALCARLRETNGRCFRVRAQPERDGHVPIEDGDVVLETEHLFADQWNTTTHRVFDWYEGIVSNSAVKAGHYLDITDEMREIRRNTNVCGFCGHQEAAAKGLVFCDRCLDSPYLKATELHLTRMMPVELAWSERAELTDAERQYLTPEYVRLQTTGADSRNAQKLAKQRAGILKKYEQPRPLRYHAKCDTCGYVGRSFDNESDAGDDADEHAIAVGTNACHHYTRVVTEAAR